MYYLQSLIANAIGICSFSDSPSNRHLWDRYASGYSGFCLEFVLTETEKKKTVEVEEVRYDNNRENQFILDEVLKSPRVLWDTLSIKNKEFEAEKEFRIIENLEVNMLEVDIFGRAPYIRKFYDFRLTRCILGSYFPVEILDLIMSVLPPHVIIAQLLADVHGKLYDKNFGTRSGFNNYEYTSGMNSKILYERYPRQNPQTLSDRSCKGIDKMVFSQIHRPGNRKYGPLEQQVRG